MSESAWHEHRPTHHLKRGTHSFQTRTELNRSLLDSGAAPEHTQIDRDRGRREDATMRKGLMPAAGARLGCLAEHETMYLPGA